jgi:uncharacterized membrane protein YgdD (TMEM256/DUF423 family)
MKVKYWVMFAALMALCAVVMGAFASHGLKDILSIKALAWIDTAAQYQMYHALALLALACIILQTGRSLVSSLCGCSFILGIFGFSGSLYALAFGGPKVLVFVTPIGGLMLILGWILLILTAIKLDTGTEH